MSGCPRNCAEATCKDVGIICVDGGYEIGVAGAAGMDLLKTRPLAKVKTETEAMDLTIAFIKEPRYDNSSGIYTGITLA